MKSSGEAYRGVDVCIGIDELQSAPHCPHGPTLLFEQYMNGLSQPKRFFACSAFRDRKDCNFFLPADRVTAKNKLSSHTDRSSHQTPSTIGNKTGQYFKRLKEFRKLPQSCRNFCQTCGVLLTAEETVNHEGHTIVNSLKKIQLRRPTSILQPLSDNHGNAQYFFTDVCVKFFISLMNKLKVGKVLCIGTPRLFEEMREFNRRQGDSGSRIGCLLLDLDDRLEQFFGRRMMCRYNMFNHYFFNGDKSRQVYLDFLRQVASEPTSEHSNFLVVMDPPFGGLVEVLSFTLKQITYDYCQVNEAVLNNSLIPTFWVFPYFQESRITSALPTFKMLDYRVEYENHSDFKSRDDGGCVKGSPVRIFTNLEASSIHLPTTEGYWFCSKCRRYSAAENRHCELCNQCTTKSTNCLGPYSRCQFLDDTGAQVGDTYVHCMKCKRCVKSTWRHCKGCNSCELPGRHTKGIGQKGCHICNDPGHKRLHCPLRTSGRFTANVNNADASPATRKKRVADLQKPKMSVKRKRR